MNKHVIINPETSVDIINSLEKLNFNVIKISILPSLAKPIQGHPDLQVFIHNKTVFCTKNIDSHITSLLQSKYNDLVICDFMPKDPYPNDVGFNIANLNNKVICNEKYINLEIKKYFEKNNIKTIHTNQGYTKCSTLTIDEASIITADSSIHKAALNNSIDSLLITPGYIDLSGYSYGFIGGATGVYENTVYATGSLDNHPDHQKIQDFVSSKGKSITYLSKNTIIDLGSLFFF